VTAFLLCALLVVTAPWQVPAQRAKPPTAVHDTVRVFMQPPPVVNVEAPSQVSSIVLGIIGAFLLGLQVWIMLRQTDALNRQTALSVKQTELQGHQTEAISRQTALMDKQTVLQEQQATARRDEAIGTFYRIAFDLVDEFRKANVMTGTPIPANSDTHPRQMLREAARLFAPLGNAFVLAATETAYALERYFVDVEAYNQRPGGRDGADRWHAVQMAREQVGIRLDMTNWHIEDGLRRKYDSGKEYDFRLLCPMPPGIAKAIGGPTAQAPESSGEQT